MAEKVIEIIDLPDELKNSPFEDLVLQVFKAHQDAIRNLQERIEKLEQGGK